MKEDTRLTRKVRNALYKSTLKYLKRAGRHKGMCYYLTYCGYNRSIKISPIIDFYYVKNMKRLPEIWRHKPKNIRGDNYWFNVRNKKRREKIFEEAIKDTE